jgi:hypothetical protein
MNVILLQIKSKIKRNMTQKINLKRGDKITYIREIMFKGIEQATATVVAIFGTFALLDNGDRITVY